jgi:hypothetical protein
MSRTGALSSIPLRHWRRHQHEHRPRCHGSHSPVARMPGGPGLQRRCARWVRRERLRVGPSAGRSERTVTPRALTRRRAREAVVSGRRPTQGPPAGATTCSPDFGAAPTGAGQRCRSSRALGLLRHRVHLGCTLRYRRLRARCVPRRHIGARRGEDWRGFGTQPARDARCYRAPLFPEAGDLRKRGSGCRRPRWTRR